MSRKPKFPESLYNVFYQARSGSPYELVASSEYMQGALLAKADFAEEIGVQATRLTIVAYRNPDVPRQGSEGI